MVGNARVEWENSDNHKLQVTPCLATSSRLKEIKRRLGHVSGQAEDWLPVEDMQETEGTEKGQEAKHKIEEKEKKQTRDISMGLGVCVCVCDEEGGRRGAKRDRENRAGGGGGGPRGTGGF
jgi:hypothetical protein